MTDSVAELMHRSLMEVFNERDPARRASTVAEIYTSDVAWHEPDRLIRGATELDARAGELQAESPGWVFRPAGPVSVNDDLGHLGFHFGPADQPPVVTGFDVARCRDGRIVELYTFVTEVHQPT